MASKSNKPVIIGSSIVGGIGFLLFVICIFVNSGCNGKKETAKKPASTPVIRTDEEKAAEKKAEVIAAAKKKADEKALEIVDLGIEIFKKNQILKKLKDDQEAERVATAQLKLKDDKAKREAAEKVAEAKRVADEAKRAEDEKTRLAAETKKREDAIRLTAKVKKMRIDGDKELRDMQIKGDKKIAELEEVALTLKQALPFLLAKEKKLEDRQTLIKESREANEKVLLERSNLKARIETRAAEIEQEIALQLNP